MIFYIQDICKYNKAVVGSGSEGTSKYVGEGVMYGLHFLIFHLDASDDVSLLGPE